MCLYAFYHRRPGAEKSTFYSTRVPYWNDSEILLSTKDMNITKTRIQLALDQFNTTCQQVRQHPLYKDHPKELVEDFEILENIFESHRAAMQDAEKERKKLAKTSLDWVPDGDEDIVKEDDPVPTEEELAKLLEGMKRAELDPAKPTKKAVDEHRPTELAMALDRVYRASKDLATITSLWWDWLSPEQLSSTYGQQGPYVLLKLESTNDDTDGTVTMFKADGSGKADFSDIPKRQLPSRGKGKVDYDKLLESLQEMRLKEAEKARAVVKESGKDEFGQNRNSLKAFYESVDLSVEDEGDEAGRGAEEDGSEEVGE